MKQRIRDRRNRYGRRDQLRRPPKHKGTLPSFLQTAIANVRGRPLPLLLGRARRSELQKSTAAVAAVMLARTDIMSGRIGRPSVKNPRRFDGLTIDYDLAPLANVGESAIERLIGTWEDWGWLHYKTVPAGRRKSKRGFIRCAAQPIETLPDGQRRGRAAVRVWTDAFWRWLGAFAALAEAREARKRAEDAAAGLRRLPVRELVDQLADQHAHPDAAPRERPPP